MELLTVKEAAKFLRVSSSFLYHDKLVKKEIPFVQIGRKIRYEKSALENIVKQSRFDEEK